MDGKEGNMLFKRNSKQKKENGIQIESLTYNEHEYTRPLWEMTFDEDSEEFIDFYYNYKVNNNSIWVAKEDELILSMAQLNPYQVHLGTAIVPAHYIVGVATHEEYRRQGLMRNILQASFQHLYDNKEPFTYLMPAKEEYYTGFDFLSVYYQKKGVLLTSSDETELSYKIALDEDFEELAQFSETLLSKKYRLFVHREVSYYQTLKAQFEAEHGGIICVYDANTLIGYFFFGEHDTIEVIEPVCLDSYKEEFTRVIAKVFKESEKEIHVTAFDYLNEDDFKNIVTKPVTMIRIICLDMFFKYMKASEPIELVIEVQDPLIEQNNGVYELFIGLNNTQMNQTTKNPELSLSISELCAICFFDKIPKAVEERAEIQTVKKLSKIEKFTPIFLNDFV